jgi:hypothetical protein
MTGKQKLVVAIILWAVILLGALPIFPVVDRYEGDKPVYVWEAPLSMVGRADRIQALEDKLFQ